MIDTAEQLAVRALLSKVAEYRASDLHLTVGLSPVLRVDGRLVALSEEDIITADSIKRLLNFLLTDEQRLILEQEKEVVTSFTFDDRARFTIHAFFQKGYAALSLKFIPEQPPTLTELGLPRAVSRILDAHRGLALVVGPFGAGKSTTLASLASEFNRQRGSRIVTIERPIEYVLSSDKSIIEQREVGRDTPSFARGLRSLLEEDVDVVLCSHLPDAETVDLALQLVESGRLVLAGANADSIVKAIQRLITFFSYSQQETARTRLAEALNLVVVQRLLPRIGGGRVVAAGVLVMTPPIRSIIREGELLQLNNVLATSREDGMLSLDRSLAGLVSRGQVVRDDAMAAAVDPDNLSILTRTAA